MGCGGCGSRLQSHKFLSAFEDRIKVQSVTMDEACGLDTMLEEKVNILKLLEGAATFKIENKTIWCMCQVFTGVISVYDRLAELFLKSFLFKDS